VLHAVSTNAVLSSGATVIDLGATVQHNCGTDRYGRRTTDTRHGVNLNPSLSTPRSTHACLTSNLDIVDGMLITVILSRGGLSVPVRNLQAGSGALDVMVKRDAKKSIRVDVCVVRALRYYENV
jgi:hypothetical protein